MVQKVLFLVNRLHFKKMTTVIPIKRLWLFLKNKVLTTFEPCPEINKAYKKRSLRIHSDKQANQKTPIPADVCDTLFNDLTRARDHLKEDEHQDRVGLD